MAASLQVKLVPYHISFDSRRCVFDWRAYDVIGNLGKIFEVLATIVISIDCPSGKMLVNLSSPLSSHAI